MENYYVSVIYSISKEHQQNIVYITLILNLYKSSYKAELERNIYAVRLEIITKIKQTCSLHQSVDQICKD
jgi:hypothetical protein